MGTSSWILLISSRDISLAVTTLAMLAYYRWGNWLPAQDQVMEG